MVLNEPLFLFRAFRVFRGQSHFSSPLCSSRSLWLRTLLPLPFGSWGLCVRSSPSHVFADFPTPPKTIRMRIRRRRLKPPTPGPPPFRGFRVFRGYDSLPLPLAASRALLLNHLLPQPETFGSQNAHASRHGNSSLFILPLCLGAFVRDPLLPQPKPQVGTLTRPATKELPILTPFCVFCDLCGKNSS